MFVPFGTINIQFNGVFPLCFSKVFSKAAFLASESLGNVANSFARLVKSKIL